MAYVNDVIVFWGVTVTVEKTEGGKQTFYKQEKKSEVLKEIVPKISEKVYEGINVNSRKELVKNI